MAYDMNIQDVKQNQQEVVKPAKKERPPKVNAPGKPVRIALLVISALLIPVSLVFPLFILAQVAVAVGSLLLCLWKPAYFVLEWQVARKSMKTQSMHLVWMISCVGVFLHWMRYDYLNPRMALLVFAVGAAIMVLVLRLAMPSLWKGKKFRKTLVLGAILLGIGLTSEGNHFLNFDPAEPELYRVVEKESVVSKRSTRRKHKINAGRKTTKYYIYIQLDSGKIIKEKISEQEYAEIDIGDLVEVVVDTGAFGIAYAYCP